MSNRLKNEKSPYLLQHAENPVDWYPWCKEAFEKAEREEKPVFLSIGYSTCHWCHVMERESFENMEIADILNEYFVSVKVDREERPDIDSVYMSVCQTLTGSGGWPLSIFMTPLQRPFFAGTYFPPESQKGMTGLKELLLAIAEKWRKDKRKLVRSADELLAYLELHKSAEKAEDGKEDIDGSLPDRAAKILAESFDCVHGGFGEAPKFPMPFNLLFLTLYSWIYKDRNAFRQVEATLLKMRRGGIFDHIGYGFSRYSTDKYYLVPHFEKMLYDNALLIIAYAAAYKISGSKELLYTAEKTARYVLREMTGPNGEFYSAQDADSEGFEGRFYVWEYDEICRLLGTERGKDFCEYFGITREGNFEGKSIPNLLNGNELNDGFEKEKEILYHYRKARIKLHLDDKVLTAWNALMISALSILYKVTGKESYITAAVRSQKFLEDNLDDNGVLYVSCREGRSTVKGFLDEYAYYTAALIGLYEACGENKYLEQAECFCKKAVKQFLDERDGGYFLYGSENGRLITRPKENYDNALPSGNSVMSYCLVRLFQITGRERYEREAKRQLAYMSRESCHYPAGCCMFLTALLLYDNPPRKITVVLGKDDREKDIVPHLPLTAEIKVLRDEAEGYRRLNGRTTYYVCEGHRCMPPANEMPKR